MSYPAFHGVSQMAMYACPSLRNCANQGMYPPAVSNRPPKGPKYRAESLAILFTKEKRGYASLDRQTKGYPLSSFSRML